MSEDVLVKGKLQKIMPVPTREDLLALIEAEGIDSSACEASGCSDQDLKDILQTELDEEKYVDLPSFGFCKVLEIQTEQALDFLHYRKLPGDVIEFETVYYNGGCGWEEFLEEKMEENLK
jgi:hypothetical protein